MNRKWIVVASVATVVVAFIAGALVFKDREKLEVTQAARTNSEALVRASSPVFGNPAARVTIVEFRRRKQSRHSCETKVVTPPLTTMAGGPKPSNGAGFQGLRSKVVTSQSTFWQRSKVVTAFLMG